AIATVCAGTLEGWTSPALPYLQQNETGTLAITDVEASWIGSLGGLGALFGSLPAGLLADKIGRKSVLLGVTLPYLMGWIIIILARKSVIMLYSGRFILGLATGASTVVVPLYAEEISETSIRGELGSYTDLSITVGILYVYAFGTFVPYTWLCISCLVLPLVFAVTFFWMPESPMYLLSKGRKFEAEKSLRWLRNISTLDTASDTKTEFDKMEESSNESCDNSKFFIKFTASSLVLKSLRLVLALMVFEQLTGTNAVDFYTVDIFEAADSTLSPYYCTLIVGVVQVIATFIAALLMDRLGRRFLLIVSSLGMAISLFVLSGFSLTKDQGGDVSSVNWIPLLGLNLYTVCFSIGFGPVPWIITVELCTSETVGWISSLATSVNWGMIFLMTKVFILVLKAWGQAVTYGILCVLCVCASVFVFTCIPETRGKSRHEIQAILSGK
ncbi:hypothetical protein L9F63_021965, partial [Diploptera punctata]